MSTPRTLKVVLPLPDRKLHPNSSCHWKAKMGPKKKARMDAQVATHWAIHDAETLPVAAFASGEIEVQTTFFKRTRHVADADNALASLKHHYDGIADQLGTNDSRFIHLPVIFALDKLNPRVEIELREVIERNPPVKKPKRKASVKP